MYQLTTLNSHTLILTVKSSHRPSSESVTFLFHPPSLVPFLTLTRVQSKPVLAVSQPHLCDYMRLCHSEAYLTSSYPKYLLHEIFLLTVNKIHKKK